MKDIYFFTTDITIKAGIERITINLANYFVQQGIAVTIVSNFKSNEKVSYKADDKINFVYLNESKFADGIGSITRLKQFLRNKKKIKNYFFNIENACIINQAFPLSFMFWFACGRSKKNKVFNVEHVGYFYYGQLIRILRYIIYKKYSGVIVLTEADKKCYDKLKIKSTVIPNGIEMEKIINNSPRKNVICGIGRLDPPKRFDSLIRAFSRISDRYPDWVVEIYGQGSIKKELEHLIIEKKLDQKVVLKGVINNVNEVLQKNSIFVVSSEYEGFSIVLIEAMSNGIACISYDCPTGPREIVTSGYDGLLVENQNEIELANSIEYLINNENERVRLGTNAKNSVQKYEIKNIAQKWIKLFLEQE